MPQYGPFTRGATVRFRLQFLDADGALTNPVSADIHINFPLANGERGDREEVMVQNGDYWTYEWNSMEAEPGLINCYAHTDETDPPVSAINFRFQLLSNRANATAKIVDAA